MSQIRTKLSFNTMGELDRGSLRIAINDALKLMRQDLLDRPLLEAKRKMTLTVTMEPVVDKQNTNGNDLAEVSIGWGVDVKIPSKGSAMTTAMAQNDGELAFMVDMPDAGSDNTIFDEAERRKLEREERGKAAQAAMQQQENGDGVKPN